MKRIVFVMLAILALKDPTTAQTSRITITSEYVGSPFAGDGRLEDIRRYRFTGTGTATIDWGDGTQPETVTLSELNEDVEEWGGLAGATDGVWHTYSEECTRTITITGHITGLDLLGERAFHRRTVTALDVGQMPGLEVLYCNGQRLSSFDVSRNRALTILNCSDNYLRSALDLRGNTRLRLLWCENNYFSSLDVSGCGKLEGLRCGGNDLTSLDIRGCTALRDLNCNDNELQRSAIMSILNSLPEQREKPEDVSEWPFVQCDNNPGCNEAFIEEIGGIMEAKGWGIALFHIVEPSVFE